MGSYLRNHAMDDLAAAFARLVAARDLVCGMRTGGNGFLADLVYDGLVPGSAAALADTPRFDVIRETHDVDRAAAEHDLVSLVVDALVDALLRPVYVRILI
jgi:hypothetical protein